MAPAAASSPRLLPEGTIARLIAIAREAGAAAMAHFGDSRSTAKTDGSPVTQADTAAERVVEAGIAALGLGHPIVAEEASAAGGPPVIDAGRPFWLVDPLDGTRQFVAGVPEFTVNIALVADRRPALGSIVAPALGEAYWGGDGLGAWHDPGSGARAIAVRPPPSAGITLLASRSHRRPGDDADRLAGHVVAAHRRMGSSLKLCLIAAGEADLYIRHGRTMEWDTAAGHAILEAAGGRLRALDGGRFAYGKPGFVNPGFVADSGAVEVCPV
ncbi:MAG: 3'(2'),5'-bisphosphate nucleotidase CysQ [Azospirillaceae bacterium]